MFCIFQGNFYHNSICQQGAAEWNTSEAQCTTLCDLVPVRRYDMYLRHFDLFEPDISQILQVESAGSEAFRMGHDQESDSVVNPVHYDDLQQ